MKTYLECVKQAASFRGLKGAIKQLYFELPQELIETLKEAADIYATQSNSHKQVVMQGLLSKCPNCKGTGLDPEITNYDNPQNSSPTVGQRSVGTNAEGRTCDSCKHNLNTNLYLCSACDSNYSLWEAPSGGHL